MDQGETGVPPAMGGEVAVTACVRDEAAARGAASVSTLFVCVTCRRASDAAAEAGGAVARAGARLLADLERSIGETGEELRLVPVECLSNCNRSCTVAVTAPGKWTYVIGDIDADAGGGDVLAFARLHQAHAEGVPVWRERPQSVRKATVARIPPLPAGVATALNKDSLP